MEVSWIIWPFWLPSFVLFPDIFLSFCSCGDHACDTILEMWTDVCLILSQIFLSMVLKCLFVIPNTTELFCSLNTLFRWFQVLGHPDTKVFLNSKHIVLFPSDIVYTVGVSCPMCITLHLSILKESNHFFEHSINKFRFCCRSSLSPLSLILVQIFVSSANIIKLQLTQSGRSLTNINTELR